MGGKIARGVSCFDFDLGFDDWFSRVLDDWFRAALGKLMIIDRVFSEKFAGNDEKFSASAASRSGSQLRDFFRGSSRGSERQLAKNFSLFLWFALASFPKSVEHVTKFFSARRVYRVDFPPQKERPRSRRFAGVGKMI